MWTKGLSRKARYRTERCFYHERSGPHVTFFTLLSVVQELNQQIVFKTLQHAVIEQRDGKFFLRAMSGAAVFHNGTTVTEEEEIHHTDRVMFGSNYVLRFHHPELHEQWVEERTNAGENAELRDVYSWDVAQKEFAIAQVWHQSVGDSNCLGRRSCWSNWEHGSRDGQTENGKVRMHYSIVFHTPCTMVVHIVGSLYDIIREKEITEHIARLIGLGAAESDPVKKEVGLNLCPGMAWQLRKYPCSWSWSKMRWRP